MMNDEWREQVVGPRKNFSYTVSHRTPFRTVKARTGVWIWPGMSGSSARIGMQGIIIKKVLIKIPRDLETAPAG